MQKFRDRLAQELAQRRKGNPRYSLRAFAGFLEADHSTVSQILRGVRPIPSQLLRRWAAKLGMEPEEASAWVAAEQLPEPGAAERERQLRHWTAEAVAIASDDTHWRLVQIARESRAIVDCRTIAEELGVTADCVNVAFTRLLGLRLLATSGDGCWQDTCEPKPQTELEFRRLALTRIRAQAAAWRLQLTPLRSSTNAKSRR